MFTYLASDPDVVRLGERILATAGATEERETRDFLYDVVDNLGDKVDLTRIVTAGLNIAPHRVQLQIFDKATGDFHYRPLG